MHEDLRRSLAIVLQRAHARAVRALTLTALFMSDAIARPNP
ncbi:hypothetical protein VSR68_22080 [Paraburkholderia phymatum]